MPSEPDQPRPGGPSILALGAVVLLSALVTWWWVGRPAGPQPARAAPLTTGAPSPGASSAPPPGVANTVCPLMDEPIDADAPVVEFQGMTIGLCCERCWWEWEQLDGRARRGALGRAGLIDEPTALQE